VISLYLDARVNENGKRNFMPFVRKQLGERAKTFDMRTPEREAFEADSSRIFAYLENGIEPAVSGLTIFACSGAETLQARSAAARES